MKRKREVDIRDVETETRMTDGAAAFSRVDEPTLLYFKEIKIHLDEATDEEQQTTLASNALTEAKGRLVAHTPWKDSLA